MVHVLVWLLVVCVTSCLAQQDCGRRDIRELRVDGETVKSDQPWLVTVHYRSTPTSTSYSVQTTGTLISTKHVVTGAYRVTEVNGSAIPAAQLRLTAGKHIEAYDVTEANAQTRGVTSVHIHEQYSEDTRVHNIALLVADRQFELTWNVNIACVDWSGQMQAPIPSQHVIVAGYGRGVNTTNNVYGVQPRAMVAHTDCQTSAREEYRRYLAPDDICARTSGNVTCYSSYGGGLMAERPTARGARFFLVAVRRYSVDYTKHGDCFSELTSYTTLLSQGSWLSRHVDTSLTDVTAT